MLYRCKFADTFSDTFNRYACIIGHSRCSHYIFKVMFAQQLQIVCFYKRNLLILCFQNDLSVLQENSFFQSSFTGKIYGLRHNIFSEFSENRILIVQNTHILRLLIFYDQFLHTDIFFHSMMTVQMILCYIQNRADTRSELFNGFKLKAGDLSHCHRILGHFQSFGSIRSSDISNYKYRILGILHDLSKKGCCCCFSVCSGNCKNSPFPCTESKFNLSPYRKALLIKAFYQRKVRRYPGA